MQVYLMMQCVVPLLMGYLHREGRFCGRCQVDYGLAVYSYQYTNCIPFTDYGLKNWLKYFAVSLLPLTLFYILVVTLRLSVTSSRLNGVLFILQCLMSPLQLRIYNGMLYAKRPINKHDFSPALVVATSIFGIVNLDFFRDAYPPICLHPRFNILHVLSLDYLSIPSF